MNISERIFSRRNALGLSKTALAKAVGVSDVSVGKWESGFNQPKGRYLNDLAAALHVSVEWILTGSEGDEAVSTPASQIDQPNVVAARLPAGIQVPIISYVQAGHWREMSEEARCFDGSVEFVAVGEGVGPHTFALWVRGDSMLPQFKEGDLIIVDPDEAPQPGDFVVAKNGSDEATFKKYRPRGIDENGNDVFELIPLNEDFPSMHSDRQHIEIIGVMVEHRAFRKRQVGR